MNKRLLWALLLIAAAIIVLLVNAHGAVIIVLIPRVLQSCQMSKAVAFLIFMILGAAIGILVK